MNGTALTLLRYNYSEIVIITPGKNCEKKLRKKIANCGSGFLPLENRGKSATSQIMASIFQRMMIAVLTVISAAGQVVINEVYAHDEAGNFLAADGGRYDWIELHNRGEAEVDLIGHFLTDRSSDPGKWQFPRSFTIPAGGHRVIFASDLDALVMGQEHLNFKLSSSGEYLGLIAPDGVTIVDQFAPSYPETDNRVTFGRPEDNGEPTLLIEPTPGSINSATPILPSVLHFELTPNPAVRGSIVTARWETENAESTRLGSTDPFRGEGASNLLNSGSLQFRAESSLAYSLAAVSRYATDSSEINLEVLEAPLSFQATPTTLATGGMTVLRWQPQFFHESINVTLNGKPISTRNGRVIFFPTNDVIMTTAGNWKKAPGIPEADWESIEFDDRAWAESNSPNETGFYRRKFDVKNPEELTTILLDLRNTILGSLVTFRLNGQPLTSIADLGYGRYLVAPGILREEGNILAVRASHLPESTPTIEIVAWRSRDAKVTYPLTLTRIVDGEERSETIDLMVLPVDAELGSPPPIAISEFYGGDFGEDPNTAYFIELTNRSDEAVNLRGMQLAGMLYHNFSDVAEPVLQPGQFGILPRSQFAMNSYFGEGRPMIGVSEGPPSERFESPNANPIILIDRFGRIIEIGPSPFSFGFTVAAERTNFNGSSENIENWEQGSGWKESPGEDRLEIEEFTVSPNVAQRGDLVTLSWRTSRPVDLKISNGVGKVSGAEGSVEVRLPDDRDYISYRLTANGDFLVREKQISVTVPPVIRDFQSSIRVIAPYQPVTIRWGWLLRNGTLEPDPGLLPFSLDYEFELIAGAGGFGRGERWAYLPADREFQPTWNEIERPPGNWSSAETPLGVNRPGVRRVLPPNNPESTASYFRREFELKNIAEIERLVIDLLAEDGAVIYLNGNEALRVNLPDGEVTRETQALSDRSTGDLVYEEFELDRSLLVEGENVLAVSLHLFHEGGALPVDQAFDLALRAERPLPEDGRLHYTLSSENAAGRDEATLTLIIGETTTLEDWQLDWELRGEPSLSDTDGDGLTDLLEFVTGSNPTLKSPPPLWVERTANGFFDINYQQELAAIGYQLLIESSDDLEEWQEINNRGGYSYEDDEIPANSTLAIRKYRTLGTTPGTRKYYRLRVVPD